MSYRICAAQEPHYKARFNKSVVSTDFSYMHGKLPSCECQVWVIGQLEVKESLTDPGQFSTGLKRLALGRYCTITPGSVRLGGLFTQIQLGVLDFTFPSFHRMLVPVIPDSPVSALFKRKQESINSGLSFWLLEHKRCCVDVVSLFKKAFLQLGAKATPL